MKTYFLPDGVYKALKWTVTLAAPALTTAYVGLAAVWGWPFATEVAQTSAIVCTAIGALIGVSAITATTVPDEPETPDEDDGGGWDDDAAVMNAVMH